MDRNGLGREGAPVGGGLEELATDTGFRASVWTAPVGEPGIAEESGDDSFFVVRVDREEPARPRELGEVRERVVAAMKIEAAVAAAREAAAAVAGASDPSAAAAEAGFPLSAPAPVRRDGVGLDHDAARLVASRAFELGEGEAGYVETGAEAIVVAVTAVAEAGGDAVAEEGRLFAERLAGEMLASSELAVLNGIDGRFGARVDPAAVQRILAGPAQ